VQLLRLSPSWDGCDVVYVSTNPLYQGEAEAAAEARDQPVPRFYAVCDISRWSSKARLARCMIEIFWIVLRTRPDVIVTTGAAPGFMALLAGVPFCRKRIWIDSIANVDEMSMSGRKARSVATVWLTQWPQLADEASGPSCWGSVI